MTRYQGLEHRSRVSCTGPTRQGSGRVELHHTPAVVQPRVAAQRDQRALVCTTSAGIAVTTDAGHGAEGLLQEADLALYRAKDRGRDRADVFDEDLRTRAVGRLGTERMLRRAIDEDRLRVNYQPIIDLRTASTVAAEALVRVWAPTRASSSSPSRSSRTSPPAICRPDALQIEVTDRVLMEASNSAMSGLKTLRAAGVKVGLDDFGTGYSSLSYLRMFPLDFVKIDRSFVQALVVGGTGLAIVASIVELSHALGMAVVAEGVEIQAQLDHPIAIWLRPRPGLSFRPGGDRRAHRAARPARTARPYRWAHRRSWLRGAPPIPSDLTSHLQLD